MIKNNTARKIMYSWHGGQFSPFYAAASSGLVENWQDIKKEINSCLLICNNTKDKTELNKLMQYIEKKEENKTQYKIGNTWYYILPWFGKVNI